MKSESRHSLLLRQLKHWFGDDFVAPAEWEHFIRAVDAAYREFDLDREMLERSLELSSQELVEANAEMRGMFQAMPDLLFRVDRDGTILSLKAGSTDDLILPPAKLVGRRIHDFPLSPAREMLRDALERALAERRVVNIEYPLVRGDKTLYYEARFAPLDAEQAVVIIRNITERKSLEEKYRQSQKMDALGQLASGIAHDFNNMLTAIISSVSLVRGEGLSAAEQAAVLKDAFHAAERAAGLTRQLLAFSRREALQFRNVELREVVCNISQMLERLIGEHIKLETDFTDGGGPVLADDGMIEQALTNLVVNARDAMPQGGRVIVRTSAVTITPEEAAIRPRSRPGKFVRVTVADTGGGIAPEHLPHIFEPFYTTKAAGKGTGLGLATVYSIVEQHRGWIEVTSRMGLGTRFHIFLPRAAVEAEQERPAPPPHARGGNETILVVEDEAIVRSLIRTVLEHRGYRVLTASTGIEALRLWEAHRDALHLLITDIVIPGGLSGPQIVERIRSDRPKFKVIEISGYNNNGDGGVAADCHFLKKPFDTTVLLDRVRECLDES